MRKAVAHVIRATAAGQPMRDFIRPMGIATQRPEQQLLEPQVFRQLQPTLDKVRHAPRASAEVVGFVAELIAVMIGKRLAII